MGCHSISRRFRYASVSFVIYFGTYQVYHILWNLILCTLISFFATQLVFCRTFPEIGKDPRHGQRYDQVEDINMVRTTINMYLDKTFETLTLLFVRMTSLCIINPFINIFKVTKFQFDNFVNTSIQMVVYLVFSHTKS